MSEWFCWYWWDRFGGVLTENETPYIDIVFNFLYNKQKLEKNYYDYIAENIELGVHAIEIVNDENSAYFKESVPISKNYDLQYTLERLCSKADLYTECYTSKKTDIYKYDTLTFEGNRYGEIIDLFRYNVLVNTDDINNERIKESISLSLDWFLNNTDPVTNMLEYEYYPSTDSYSTSNNHVRQLAGLWAITESSDPMINTTLNYYLNYKNSTDNYSFLNISGSKIAYNAFLILALINTPNYPMCDTLLKEFADGILAMQRDDGSYNTDFLYETSTGIDYYPGESMLSLMKLYQVTKDNRYLDSVEKAFTYYRTYWRENPNTAFIPWHTQTYKLLHQETNNSELADFIFEMNDWLIDNYQIVEDEYPDKIGGFPKNTPRCSTSSYMESINDAYSVAVDIKDTSHIEKYAQSIKIGTRFILQTQFNNQNSFYLENTSRAIGGFKYSLTDNRQRNDMTQHAVLALIKAYNNNNIFQ